MCNDASELPKPPIFLIGFPRDVVHGIIIRNDVLYIFLIKGDLEIDHFRAVSKVGGLLFSLLYFLHNSAAPDSTIRLGLKKGFSLYFIRSDTAGGDRLAIII